mmetsp:Transcript_2513/g.5039  ORF Transcript_2513/g.5039 Transcript_2513/m.5039 type:complete len:313 (-) Transcript_2513:7-945(-)
MVIISMMMYVLSIVFLQGIEGYAGEKLDDLKLRLGTGSGNAAVCPVNSPLMRAPDPEGSWFYREDDTDMQAIQLWYGGLGVAMLTIFRSISGGAEWAEVAEPIMKINPHMYITVWVSFIGFLIFGVLNILTGIFCDAAMKAAQENEALLMQEMKEEREHSCFLLQEVFDEVDVDGSGFITREEFVEILCNPAAQAQFQILEISPNECEGLFDLLDVDDSNTVDVNEFMSGMLKLRGGAKAIDMITLVFQTKKVAKIVTNVLAHSSAHKDVLQDLHMHTKEVHAHTMEVHAHTVKAHGVRHPEVMKNVGKDLV